MTISSKEVGQAVEEKVGSILREKRASATQKAFCGNGNAMSEGTLSKIETGQKMPSIAQLVALCEENNIDVAEILSKAMPSHSGILTQPNNPRFINQLNDFTHDKHDKEIAKKMAIKLINDAEHSVFIHSFKLDDFTGSADKFAQLDANIALNVAFPSKSILRNLLCYFGGTEKQWANYRKMFSLAVEAVRETRDINDICMDLFIPIAYFAIDVETPKQSSCIYISHYFPSGVGIDEALDSYSHYLTPGMDLYDYHKGQILAIKENKGKLSNHG